MQSFINRIIRHPLLVLMAGTAMLLASHVAGAASCSGGGGTYNVPVQSAVMVARDVAIGQTLTSWASSATTTWSCTLYGNDAYISRAMPSIGGTATGQRVLGPTGSTNMYSVRPSGVPGVGIAMVSYSLGLPCYGKDWADVYTPDVVGLGNGCRAASAVDSASGTLQVNVYVALVKTGPITPGTIPAQQVAYVSPVGSDYSMAPPYYSIGGSTSYFKIPAISITQGSCTVADVDVPMGKQSPSAFTGIGAKGSAKDFTINVNNCPAGLTSVQYRLELAAGVGAANAAQGVVKLDATSSATGVGVQVTNRSDTPYDFSTMPWRNVTPTYSSAGNYTIPLRAAYYQTATAVTPGDANSAIMFTMQYL